MAKQTEPLKKPDTSQIATLEESNLNTVILEMCKLGDAVVDLLNNITLQSQFEDQEIQAAFNSLGNNLRVSVYILRTVL